MSTETIYWPREVSRMMYVSICKYIGIPQHMTVNRETVVCLDKEQVKRMEEMRGKGFIIIRKKTS